MAIKLKSEIRIKSVNGIAVGNEGQGDLFEEGDIVYSIADSNFKKRNNSAYDGGSAADSWDTVAASGGGIASLEDDGTPQLGGNLDVQANEINTATSNGNIKIAPNGTGAVEIRGNGTNDGQIQLNCSQNSHGIKLKSPPHSAGASYTLVFPNDAGSAGEVLETDGSGGLSWASNSGGPTNLSITNQSATALRIESSTGTNIDLPLAGDSNNAGLMSDADKDKLDLYPAFGSFDFTSIADTPAAYGAGDANTFLKVNGTYDGIIFQNIEISPGLMFSAKTISGSNIDILSSLNAGDGGTVTVIDGTQNVGGTNASKGVTVNVSNLTKTNKKARYEILSADSDHGFRFKADTTAINSFGGQGQISAGVGDNNGKSVGSSQKLVLLYTGAEWQYMVQSI